MDSEPILVIFMASYSAVNFEHFGILKLRAAAVAVVGLGMLYGHFFWKCGPKDDVKDRGHPPISEYENIGGTFPLAIATPILNGFLLFL